MIRPTLSLPSIFKSVCIKFIFVTAMGFYKLSVNAIVGDLLHCKSQDINCQSGDLMHQSRVIVSSSSSNIG